MSIDLTNSIETLILELAQTIEDIEPYLNPFVLEQDTNPRQSDWEAAWVLAGNTLPISEDQELYWLREGAVLGQFGRTNDRFYCIFPNNSVSLGGVTHFAYTKFLGWEDGQHFLFSGTQLNDDGQYIGLLRAYLDGTLEQVDFTGFTANTLLGYDEAQGKLWYIEGTDLKRIDTTTEVITVIASGITVAPTTIAFDGAGDAFCTINIGAGLDVYRWNNTGATFTSIKASITVNGASVDPGQVITASLNYVVVNTAVANYWVQFARSGGAEVQIKSNPAGATAPNIPEPDATAWTQILASRSLDVLSIVYTELSGTPSLSEWRRTILWNMATSSYTELAALPYDDFMTMCISEAPSAEVLNHRRDTVYHSYTLAYRKPSGSVWEYHNVSGLRSNSDLTRQILETDDGQIFVLSEGSSGKIWRLSEWDQGESDSIILDIYSITGSQIISFDLTNRPKGYDRLQLVFNTAGSNGGAAATNPYSFGALASPIRSYNIDVDANTYTHTANLAARTADNSTQGSLLLAEFFLDQDTDIYPDFCLAKSTINTGVVNQTVQYVFSLELGNGVSTTKIFSPTAIGPAVVGGYLMLRAFRTEPRRQGGAYYDPAMA